MQILGFDVQPSPVSNEPVLNDSFRAICENALNNMEPCLIKGERQKNTETEMCGLGLESLLYAALAPGLMQPLATCCSEEPAAGILEGFELQTRNSSIENFEAAPFLPINLGENGEESALGAKSAAGEESALGAQSEAGAESALGAQSEAGAESALGAQSETGINSAKMPFMAMLTPVSEQAGMPETDLSKNTGVSKAPKEGYLCPLENEFALGVKEQENQISEGASLKETERRPIPDVLKNLQHNAGIEAFISSPLKEAAKPNVRAEAVETPIELTKEAFDENIQRLVKGITKSTADGTEEFKISLKPEFLGEVSIRLVKDAAGVAAHIKTAHAAAKALLQSGLPELLEQMRSKGIEVSTVDVSVEAFTSAFTDGKNNPNQSGSGATSKKWQPHSRLSQREQFMDAVEHVLLPNSSVEYQA